jgi:hypothetical protein
MDRNLVYPGSIPLDSDLLTLNRNTMVALGYLTQAVLGTSPVIDGLGCVPTTPASLGVIVQPGSITQLSVVDTLSFGSLPADPTSPLLKMGINLQPTSFTLAAPSTSGQSVNYLIQAAVQEADSNAVVLPYYNAANPSQPYSGPGNSGAAQNTQRIQRVQLQLKAGAPASTGTQSTPPIDNGWVGLFVITVAYGQSAVTASAIATLPSAPFLPWKLPALRPGFASAVQSFTASGSFTVPAGVSQVEAEVWGGGSGSYASTATLASGGGAGGGYARKRVPGLVTGQVIPITIGAGGAGGTTGGALPGTGGTSSFGPYVSATGAGLNFLDSFSAPQNGAYPPGAGIGGDLNLTGSMGQDSVAGRGGLGGGAPTGGFVASGTSGLPGTFPGGGASGAGNPGGVAYNGAAGAPGLVIIRW